MTTEEEDLVGMANIYVREADEIATELAQRDEHDDLAHRAALHASTAHVVAALARKLAKKLADAKAPPAGGGAA